MEAEKRVGHELWRRPLSGLDSVMGFNMTVDWIESSSVSVRVWRGPREFTFSNFESNIAPVDSVYWGRWESHVSDVCVL